MDNKYIKYFKIFLLGFTALGIINFMTVDGINSPARFQYRDFELGFLYRKLADLILLASIIYMIFQKWGQSIDKKYYNLASIIYISLTLIDIHIWLWWIHFGGGIYLYIVIVHTLPILIVLTEFTSEIKIKKLIFIGLSIVIIGLLFDIIFINIPYPDFNIELYEKNIRLEKVRNLFYYFGCISMIAGLIDKFKNRLTLLSQ